MPSRSDSPTMAGLLQFARFGVSGVLVTLLGVIIYWTAAEVAGIEPLAANLLAYLGCLATGYLLHSRWSFAAAGSAPIARTGARYALASLAGVLLNSFWVWLFVERLGGPTWWPIPAMIAATPPLTFLLYRSWVFAPTGARSVNH